MAQWRRKRCRCQRSTVAGATMTRACLQAGHTLDSQTQRSRSHGAPPAPPRRSPRCESGCSSSRCGSSARCVASCCICRRPSRGARRGSTSPARVARPPEAGGELRWPLARGRGVGAAGLCGVAIRAAARAYSPISRRDAPKSSCGAETVSLRPIAGPAMILDVRVAEPTPVVVQDVSIFAHWQQSWLPVSKSGRATT